MYSEVLNAQPEGTKTQTDRRVYEYHVLDGDVSEPSTRYRTPINLQQYRESVVEAIADAKRQKDEGSSHYWGGGYTWDDEIASWQRMLDAIDGGKVKIKEVDITDELTEEQRIERLIDQDTEERWGYSTTFPDLNKHLLDIAMVEDKLKNGQKTDILSYVSSQYGRLFHLSDAGEPRVFDASFALIQKLKAEHPSVFESMALDAFEQKLLYEEYWEQWDMERMFEVDARRSNPENAAEFKTAYDNFFTDTWDFDNEMYNASESELIKLAPIKPEGVYFKPSEQAIAEYRDDPLRLGSIQRIAEIKDRNWLFLEEVVKHQDAARVNTDDLIESLRTQYESGNHIRMKGDAHWRTMSEAIEAMTADLMGVDTQQLTPGARERLYEYGASLNQKTYDRLKMLARKNGVDRLALAEAFLATEFGDDYGAAILDIAEHVSPEQSAHIFETVNSLRVRTSEFAGLFKTIDPQLAWATEKAFNERVTDALTSLQEVAVKGSLHEDVAPHRNKPDYVHDGRFDIDVNSIDEAMEIIDGLEQTFGAMHNIITADDLKITKVNNHNDQFVLYRLMSESAGNMLIYIRPQGAYGYDKQMEYGNSKGIEASINLRVNPVNPHKILMPKDPGAVSIRFDHEGRLVSESPDSDRRDPTRKDGLMSADVSAGFGNPKTLPVRIGRFIAAGNRIRARHIGTADSLHHNTNHFDQDKYGDADGFAHLARSVIRQIELLKKALSVKNTGKMATRHAFELAELPKAA